MKLIVGLGNPGREYEDTRHNIGFMVLDSFACKHGISFSKEKFHGMYAEFLYEGEKIFLLKPQSYINLSGEVVAEFVRYFKISLEDLLIIHDDLDLPLGMFKLKPSGSSGGHNGLKNIELHLHTKHYKHYKIGISNNKKIDTKDYVLGRFSMEERKILSHVIDLSSEILENYIKMDFDLLMNRYNEKKRNC